MYRIRERVKGLVVGRRGLVSSILALTTAAGLLLLGEAYAIQAFTVSSASMLPTLRPREALLVDRLAYRRHAPHRGDIVVFRFPRAERREFVKRVIGLPGDVVEEQGGRVYVNGKLLEQEDTPDSGQEVGPDVTLVPHRIPPGQLFVLGDNRAASLDSRYWGAVDIDNVVGKAFLVYWSRGQHWWDLRWDRIGHWLP
jgi:signal peptidase I